MVLDFTDARGSSCGPRSTRCPTTGRPRTRACAAGCSGCSGWLLGIHLGRLDEGLALARAALETGRAHDDAVLVAQAASAVSTTSLLLGRRVDGLIEEAVAVGTEVVQSQLALWPQVLHGRQQLWDGHLGRARTNLESMHRSARSNGAEFQRAYRLDDLAQVALAAGDLDLAAQHVGDGSEAARDCGDERALAWLAYPAGLARRPPRGPGRGATRTPSGSMPGPRASGNGRGGRWRDTSGASRRPRRATGPARSTTCSARSASSTPWAVPTRASCRCCRTRSRWPASRARPTVWSTCSRRLRQQSAALGVPVGGRAGARGRRAS